MLGEMLNKVRETTPLVHNITNYVTVNDVANVLLACGGSPIMSDEPQDVEDITSICGGLNINIGTLNIRSIEGMKLAGKKAAELGHAILLDPVGAGASALRTNTAVSLMEEIPFSVIRGNISEIKTLASGSGTTKGVDADVADAVTEETVLVSIAAGIGADFIRKMTKPYAKVVLAMPNTPLLLGEGATALAKDDAVSDAEFAVVQRIFGSCGMTAVIAPEQMKEVIAINGSSPAFIYLFAKSFLDYAAKVGLPETSAKELFAQSLIGSAKMITDSGYSIDELIRQVSSPGGTTLAGLDQLYEGKLSDAVRNACESCTKRAYELAK